MTLLEDEHRRSQRAQRKHQKQQRRRKRRCAKQRRPSSLGVATVAGARVMTVSVAEHCRRIKAHIAKGDKAVEKADEHYKAAGIYLKELKAEHGGTWAKWERLLKSKVGISTGRASELMQVADGRKTVEKLRADKAESVRQVRARASSLRSEETTALVQAGQAPPDDRTALAEAPDQDAAKVDDDGTAEGAELNRFTRRVQKFHTEIYNALQKWCQAHPDPARLPDDQRAGLVGALRHVANDFTVLAQRLDPERLKEIVARYIDPEEAERAENAIEVSPTAEPADVIEPDDCDGVLVT
jgi:hypothetical protein